MAEPSAVLETRFSSGGRLTVLFGCMQVVWNKKAIVLYEKRTRGLALVFSPRPLRRGARPRRRRRRRPRARD